MKLAEITTTTLTVEAEAAGVSPKDWLFDYVVEHFDVKLDKRERLETLLDKAKMFERQHENGRKAELKRMADATHVLNIETGRILEATPELLGYAAHIVPCDAEGRRL